MEKKNFKRVFSKTFVASLAAVALVGGAKAYNVKETTTESTDRPYIEDLQYVYGITKYSTTTKLTVGVTGVGYQNYILFDRDNLDKEVPVLYQWVAGDWYGFKADGSLFDPSNAEIAKLNESDIYYIDNVEKTLPIKYSRDIPAGASIVAKSNKPGQVVEYDAEEGILYVPVTADVITISQKTGDSETVLDTYTRISLDGEDKNEFDYTTNSVSYGSIAADGVYTKGANATVSGNTITVNGTIAWSNGKDAIGVGETGAGHRIGVILTVPNGTNMSNLNSISVKYGLQGAAKEDIKTTTWKSENTNSDNQFWFTPVVKAGETYTVTVVWDAANNITQTFTVKVNGTLEEVPAGSIAGEDVTKKVDNKDVVTLSAVANADNTVLTYNSVNGGKAAWNEKATLLVTPNAAYTSDENFSLGAVDVKLENRVLAQNEDGTDEWVLAEGNAPQVTIKPVGESGVLAIEVPFVENTETFEGRKAVVTVTWPDGYAQPIEVVLSDATDFEFPAVTLLAASGSKRYTPEEETPDMVEVKGIIAWNKDLGGNLVEVELENDAEFGEYAKNLTVSVDGKVITEKNAKGEEVPVSFTDNALTFKFAAKEDTVHSVKVLYNDKVVKEFSVDVTGATLEDKETGRIVSADKDGIIGSYSKANRTLTLEADTKNDAVPFNYSLYNNAAAIILSNDSYGDAAKSVKYTFKGVEYTANKEADGSYYIKVAKSGTTTVTVAWDDVNVETFTVAVDSDTKFEAAKAGSVSIEEPTSDERVNKVDLDNTTKANWTGTTAEDVTNLEKDTVKGYVLKDVYLTAPEGSIADDATTVADDAYLVISGGHYGTQGLRLDAESLQNITLKDVTTSIEDDATTPDVDESASFARKALVINPILKTANDRLTIKVCWGGEFVETYYVNAYSVDLVVTKADVTVGETGNAEYTKNEGTIYYSEDIKYADGFHVVKATLSETDGLTKVVVKDANPNAKANESDKEETIREIAVGELVDDGFDIYLLNETGKKTAEVKLVWDNGYEQVVTVNCQKAALPTIKLNESVLDKNEDGTLKVTDGKYSMTVTVGASVKFASTISPSNYSKYLTYAVTDEEVIDADTLVAKKYGKTEVKATLENEGTDMGAKEVTVVVNVVTGKEVVVSNANVAVDKKNNKITVSANVAGGLSGIYDVTVKPYVLVDSEWNASVTTSNTPEVIVENGKYVVSYEFTDAEGTAEEDRAINKVYKFVVTAVDKKQADVTTDTKLTGTAEVATENVAYRVTVKSENGSADTTYTAKPGSTLAEVEILETEPTKTSSDPAKEYTFAGWAYATDIDPETGDIKEDCDYITDLSNKIKDNVTIVAVYTESDVTNDVKVVEQTDFETAKVTVNVKYGEAVTLAEDYDYYVYNDDNFDALGGLRNNATKFDLETKITGKLTLVRVAKN